MSTNDKGFVNPYAAPETPLTGAPAGSSPGLAEQEAIRRKYLNHEASVKSVGSLHILGGILYVFALVVMLMQLSNQAPGVSASIGGIVALAAVIVINIGVGFGLTKLQTWARWTDVILSALGFVLTGFTLVTFLLVGAAGNNPAGNNPAITGLLIGYGIGLLIIGYVIYLLVSPKGSVVFSPDYREVIKATPHIKYKTSCLVKGLMLVLLAFFLLGIVSFFFRSR